MDTITRTFENAFKSLSVRWRSIADAAFSTDDSEEAKTLLVRSAARVEQAFGGINAQLWDDPYEWTLPEIVNSRAKVLEYLDEVDSARTEGFGRITTDQDLSREIWTPRGAMPLARLLLETAVAAGSLADAAMRSVPNAAARN